MDYIYIYDDKNNKTKMEVVTIFEIDNSFYHYIIYRTIDKKHVYFGKYEGNEITELITDLTKKELLIGKSIYEQIEGEDNARSE